jgi:ABC-type multidrug transport system ATPase subunit
MSKGMIVQLHLALVMAIDAKLLVLDEPTLGLDILYRKQFYQNLLEDYFRRRARRSSSPPTRSKRSNTSSPT